jgi:sugar phosphate isomerase/epimerase
LTPERLVAEAKAAGIEGIEWRYKETPEEVKGQAPSFWGNNLCTIDPRSEESEQLKFRTAAEQNGVKVISVTPYLGVGDLAGTEQVLRTARLLGASYIRVGVAGYNRTQHFGELFEQTRAYLREASELCLKYGVKGLVETHHNTIAASASASYRLVEGLDPDTIGVLYDPGNMVHEGYENYRMGLELLGPYLAHVHVKNAGWFPGESDERGNAVWSSNWAPMRAGAVPWKQVIDDLKAVDYDGYLGVEDFSGQYESAEMLRQFAAYMRELIG